MSGLLRRELLAGAVVLPVLWRPARRASIFIAMTGGASQLDTFDPKPDAPADIRGPFRAINTNVPGVQISELFPLMARQAHRYALVRSVYTPEPAIHRVAAIGTATNSFREAFRLVQAGETEVTVNMFDSVAGSTWDTHGWGPFATMADMRDRVAPRFDAGFCGLLNDLDNSGLLATTRVIATGEFGRTPRLNPDGGRDHWTRCWTAVLAGAGVRGGQVFGSSDAIGAEPRDNPVEASTLPVLILD